MNLISNKFPTICRICADDARGTLTSLFKTQRNGITLAEMASNCVQLPIELTDERPSNICRKCVENLKVSYEFCKLARESEIKFQQMICAQKLPSSIPKIESVSLEADDFNIQLFEEHSDMEIKEQNDSSDSNFGGDIEHIVVTEEGQSQKVGDGGQANNKKYIKQQVSKSRKVKRTKKAQKKKKNTTGTKAKLPDRTYECYKCKEIFKNRKYLGRHMKEHIKATPNKCDVCGMYFSSHRINRHLCKGKNVQCEYCSQESFFETTIGLLEHLKVHQDQRVLNKCADCPKIFPMKYLLECHLIQHEIKATYTCEECGSCHANSIALAVHRHVHSTEKPHLCNACGKSFRTEFQLVNHSIVHSDARPFACSDCTSRFKRKGELKQHYADQHSGAKFACDSCDKVYSKQSSLNNHKRSKHLQIRSGTCEICGIKLHSNTHKKNHLLIHTGEKPHKCEYCDMAYRLRGGLYKHMRIHLGENIYQCKMCPQSFRLQTELRKHSFEHYQKKKEAESS